MKKWAKIVFIVVLFISLPPAGCGKKGPPFLVVRKTSFMVTPLKAVQQEDGLYLTGSVVHAPNMDPSSVSGCKIYHALYPLDNAPCEGCPLDYQFLKEIKGKIISENHFSCRILTKPKPGIHFFLVRLMDEEGGIGPYSDTAKVIVEQKPSGF